MRDTGNLLLPGDRRFWYTCAVAKKQEKRPKGISEPQAHKVLVAVRMGNATGRQRLRGVFRYLSERADWDVQLVRSESELTPKCVRQVCEDGTEGFLVLFHPDARTISALASSNRPVATFADDFPIGKHRNLLRLPDENNVLIGETAARHFLSLGRYRSFGFVPDTDNLFWSQLRLEGFKQALGRRTDALSVYEKAAMDNDITDRHAMTNWLVSLPKPAAVMASWDYRAAQVLSACHDVKLSVPSQVAVLGVDDEDFICEGVSPHLTSIRVNREGQGYAASAVLDNMLLGRKARKLDATPFRSVKLVVRASTAPISPSADLTTRAQSFIAQNACNGISVAEVARHLGVSRRLLDLRFEELGLGGVAENIRQRRLETARKLIDTTRQPLTRIAAACGFANVDSLRNMLRKRFGRSIRAMRNIATETA